MRLIDADALIEETRRRFPSASTLVRIKRMITDAPTAYNVDAVVEQLEDAKEDYREYRDGKLVYEITASVSGINKAIDIVRKGGAE